MHIMTVSTSGFDGLLPKGGSNVLPLSDTPSITAKLINEQKEDKEKKKHDEKEKMKTDSGFQDNFSVVVASGTHLAPSSSQTLTASFPSHACQSLWLRRNGLIDSK